MTTSRAQSSSTNRRRCGATRRVKGTSRRGEGVARRCGQDGAPGSILRYAPGLAPDPNASITLGLGSREEAGTVGEQHGLETRARAKLRQHRAHVVANGLDG